MTGKVLFVSCIKHADLIPNRRFLDCDDSFDTIANTETVANTDAMAQTN